MRLAAESPYPGERANARAAARRLAVSHGMSLDEAAHAGVKPKRPPEREPEVDPGAGRWQGHGGFRKQDYDTGERPEVDELRQYARARQEERKRWDEADRLAVFCMFVAMMFALLNWITE